MVIGHRSTTGRRTANRRPFGRDSPARGETRRRDDGRAKGNYRSDLGFSETQVTLAETGIDKNLANRARKLHALPEQELEHVPAELNRRDSQERVGGRV
jgi:hypothetical protein